MGLRKRGPRLLCPTPPRALVVRIIIALNPNLLQHTPIGGYPNFTGEETGGLEGRHAVRQSLGSKSSDSSGGVRLDPRLLSDPLLDSPSCRPRGALGGQEGATSPGLIPGTGEKQGPGPGTSGRRGLGARLGLAPPPRGRTHTRTRKISGQPIGGGGVAGAGER